MKVADVQPGKKNPSVLIVQKALAKAVGLDYSSGPGTFGNHTKAAYAKWQRKSGFSPGEQRAAWKDPEYRARLSPDHPCVPTSPSPTTPRQGTRYRQAPTRLRQARSGGAWAALP